MTEVSIMYLCDGSACEYAYSDGWCGKICKHTTKLEHAKNHDKINKEDIFEFLANCNSYVWWNEDKNKPRKAHGECALKCLSDAERISFWEKDDKEPVYSDGGNVYE